MKKPTPDVTTTKIGRNDPCHCGSGEKYKKCHLEKDANEAASKSSVLDLPDRRALEGNLSSLASLQAMFGRKPSRRSAVDEAQEVMYQAWDTTNRMKRIALARKALEISNDCADAYVLLAQEEASTIDAARTCYEHAVAAGERALGKKAFKEDVGHFWGILETRGYMRARMGLGQALREMGDLDGAIGHFADMLRLNPNDNQGVRDLLATCYLEADRREELQLLLDQYEDSATAMWAYTRVLLEFRRGGDSAAARKQLASALETNPHVPDYLLGRKRMPRHLPDYVGFGDENEAVVYVAESANVWKSSTGALEWLATAGASRSGKRSKPRRAAGRSSRRRE